MKFSDLTTYIKELLAEELPDLPILLEDRGDIEFESNNALAKQGVYALVRFPLLNYQGMTNNKKISLSASSMVIQVSENIPINRHKTAYVTANEYAIKISHIILNKLSTVANLIDINVDFVEGLLIASINFETTIQITE
jgi:hypothetical protein